MRYKILHILFWGIKTVLLAHELLRNFPTDGALNYFHAINITVYQMLCVYTAIYVFIPRLVVKERYVQFALTVLALILTCSLAKTLTQIVFLKFAVHSGHVITLPLLLISYISDVVDMTIVSFIFIGIALVYHFYVKDQKNKLLERERLESELNFLKAQINPHFLFNALNSIYVLMKEDIHLSEEVLLKFSALLRYQLYDCSSNETTIEKEIEFLKNYISLENVRHGENTKVCFNVPEKNLYMKVAPFVLIPFVENAFKHISHYADKENQININLVCDRGRLDFKISNTFEDGLERTLKNHNGIGLQNVRRRLELLYSQKHTLEISRANNQFTVGLTLITDEH